MRPRKEVPDGPESGDANGSSGRREDEGEEEDRPAPTMSKLVLTAAPFLALILLFLLDRCVLGR